MKIGDVGIDSPRRMARYDRAKIKKLNIISPDTTKMHSVAYGNTTYYFRNKKKMDKFVSENLHYQILGVYIHPEDRHVPDINERFSNNNQILEKDETR